MTKYEMVRDYCHDVQYGERKYELLDVLNRGLRVSKDVAREQWKHPDTCYEWAGDLYMGRPVVYDPLDTSHEKPVLCHLLVWMIEWHKDVLPDGVWFYRVCSTKNCCRGLHIAATKAGQGRKVGLLRGKYPPSALVADGQLCIPDDVTRLIPEVSPEITASNSV